MRENLIPPIKAGIVSSIRKKKRAAGSRHPLMFQTYVIAGLPRLRPRRITAGYKLLPEESTFNDLNKQTPTPPKKIPSF